MVKSSLPVKTKAGYFLPRNRLLTSLRLEWFNRHFATLHSGFYSGKQIKAGMERSEMTASI